MTPNCIYKYNVYVYCFCLRLPCDGVAKRNLHACKKLASANPNMKKTGRQASREERQRPRKCIKLNGQNGFALRGVD